MADDDLHLTGIHADILHLPPAQIKRAPSNSASEQPLLASMAILVFALQMVHLHPAAG